MKISITLKDPDGFYESVREAVENEVAKLSGLSEDEKDELIESRKESVFEDLGKWVEYNEYVTIEFDTEAQTATVIKL